MKKLCLGFAACLALASTAMADNKDTFSTKTKGERDADGSYKTDTTTETSDMAGTNRKTEVNEKAKVYSDGSRKLTKESKASTDPKGLMNKSSAEKTVYGKTDAKGNYKGEVSTDSVSANGEELSKDKNIKRNVKADGSVVTTSSEKVVDDPRGLLNRGTGTVDTTTVHHPDGSVTGKTTKKINGTTVEETTK